MPRLTTAKIIKMKQNGEKISMLTAYDYPTALCVDNAGVHMILVGDSLGMVVLGYDSTTKVTMDDMVHHTKPVVRASQNALVVADMPFLSYHTGVYDAVSNAGRLIREGGASAVKLEGGEEILPQVKAILDAGIAVMGHLGLQPQSVNKLGGHFIQGKDEESAERIKKDARLLYEAGCFSIVLECVPKALAEEISKMLPIPIIGIGAGAGTDGQVLVLHDMVGLYPRKAPSFSKKYADLLPEIEAAAKAYVKEVSKGAFPDEKTTLM